MYLFSLFSVLWELCQQTVDLCIELNIPFKLSENMLIHDRQSSVDLYKRKAKKPMETTDPANAAEASIIRESENPKLHEVVEDIYDADPVSPSIAIQPIFTEAAVANETISLKCGENMDENSSDGSKITKNSCFAEDRAESTLSHGHSLIPKSVDIPVSKEDKLMDGKSIKQNILPIDQATKSSVDDKSLEKTANAENSTFGTKIVSNVRNGHSSSTHLATETCKGFLEGQTLMKNDNRPVSANEIGSQVRATVLAATRSVASAEDEEKNAYYHKICENAKSIVNNANQWKINSNNMPDTDLVFDLEKREGYCDENGVNLDQMQHANNGLGKSSDCGDLEINHNENTTESKEILDEKPPIGLEDVKCGEENSSLFTVDRKFGHFSNSLDILAMVASDYLDKNNFSENSDNSQDSTDVSSEQRPEKVSSLNTTESCLNEVDVDTKKVASYLCDGSLLQLNFARHPDNLALFREVWRKGKVIKGFSSIIILTQGQPSKLHKTASISPITE